MEIDPDKRSEILSGPVPEIPEPLLRYMVAMTPARCLRYGDNVEEHREYAGQQSLVAWMDYNYRFQNGLLDDTNETEVEDD